MHFWWITFTASDVNLFEDSIFIENHGLVKGEKVIYASATPVGGLISDEMYYVDVYTKDKIKLCATKGDLYLSIPNHVNITSASGGTLSLVNPNLKVYKIKQLSLICQILHYLHLVEILIILHLNLIFIGY